MASITNFSTTEKLPDRLGFDFILLLEKNHPRYKSFTMPKKTDSNYVAYISMTILETNEDLFRYLEKEATESNKDFLSDKGLFLFAIAKTVPQDSPGFISVTNEYFCTILGAIACIRIKSNKGSHGKPETPKQPRNTDILWQLNERIDKVFDCLSKYFLIKHYKETEVWTLENPVIGDCVVKFDQEKFSQMLIKLTPATRPLVRGNKAADPAAKKSKTKLDVIQSLEMSEEDVQMSQRSQMDGVVYESSQNYQPANPLQQMWSQNVPRGVQPVPYPPNMNNPYNQMVSIHNQAHNFVPMTKIERETGVPEHVWQMIEEKARNDPMVLLKMINTLIPMRDRIIAMQQSGRDPKTLFERKQ